MKLYLDMDGVQADFDTGFRKTFGFEAKDYEKKFGQKQFWKLIESHENFYGSLPKMLDVDFLWDAVDHLDPFVLTALPHSWPEEARKQKRYWFSVNRSKLAGDHFMAVVRAKNKAKFAEPGDILIDDREDIEPYWTDRGGIFIRHFNAYDTIRELKRHGVIK